jgi:hypothetical protein
VNWAVLLEKNDFAFFCDQSKRNYNVSSRMEKRKGVYSPCFCVWPTVNEQFLMNKLACTFGKFACESFYAQSKRDYKGLSSVEKCKRIYAPCFFCQADRE